MTNRAIGLGCLAALATLIAAGLWPLPSHAQSDGTSSGQVQDQPLAPPPGTSETTILGPDAGDSGAASSAAANPAAPLPPATPGVAAAPAVAAPSQWVPAQQARLTVLDKIYGSTTTVSAQAGVPFPVRFLTVTVLACWVRPPTLPPDAAVFLQVTDPHAPPGSPAEFRGWIFKAEPALAGMDDPVTAIAVDGCS